MDDKDFPCKCGHEFTVHDLGTNKACWYCPLTSKWCHDFTGDNLKYLEGQFKEK